MIKAMKGARAKLSFALALALVMGLTAASTAFADPAPIYVNPNSYAEIIKVLERPMGVHLPDPADAGFNFSATPQAFDGGTIPSGLSFPDIASISLNTNDGVLPDVWERTYPENWGVDSIERSVRFDLADLTFSRAGQYDYLVEQQPNSHEDITDSSERYILRLTVGQNNAISNVQFFDFRAGSMGAAIDSPRFISTYTPVGSLSITSEVAGADADEHKDFDFRIRLTSTSFADFDGTVDATITNAAGSGASSHTITYNQWYSFTLQHGWKMEINNLPLGTAFMVNEPAPTDYIPSVDVAVNGNIPFVYSVGDMDRAITSESALAQAFLVEERVVGAGENLVAFSHYMPDTPEPHIVQDNLVWFAVAGIGAVLFIALVVFMRKRLN
ncbi:MAG: hypothetical protein FWC99_02095 [Coriobacteriia bacterium]|nr:hypothetical protein [Coriobacteriia bacterium]